MTAKLTPKQRAFVSEYVVDKNGAQAAIRAGYSAAAAKEQAARLLTKANIRAAVSELLEKAAQRTEWTFDRWIQRLGEEANDFSEMASHSARIGALKEIGKALGHYAEDNSQKGRAQAEAFKSMLGSMFAAGAQAIVKPAADAATYNKDGDDD